MSVTGKSNTHWSIVNYQINKNNKTIKINLRENTINLSLKELSKNEKKGIEYFIKPYFLIDVNFGYYNSIMDTESLECFDNKNFFNKIISGEMHKLRPSIVLQSCGNLVQVLPLTTDGTRILNKEKQKISLNYMKKLNIHYKGEVYALPHMIQTISSYRVHPPKNIHGKRKNSYHEYQLNTTDKNRINMILAEQYNKNIVLDNKILKESKDKISHEKRKLLETNKIIRDENKKINDFIETINEDFDLNGGSIQEIIENYAKWKKH